MRSISVSTSVFAAIWAQRQGGEESEDAILSRILLGPVVLDPGSSSRLEGVEVSRTRRGVLYQGKFSGGTWILKGSNKQFRSLNQMSKAIGAGSENAWMNWFYVAGDGVRKPVGELRENVPTRPRLKRKSGVKTGSVTWIDDVAEALKRLGGSARLEVIYREVTARRAEGGRSRPPSLEAVVRKTLEENSSESDAFKGVRDLFSMPKGKGAGFWSLKAG